MNGDGRSALVNGERLWRALAEMGEAGGRPDGGCDRLALTNADRTGRLLFEGWAREAGCRVECDRFGNMFAIRDGIDSREPWVLIGSHLDTQPAGGRFDGVVGVLAGLEVVRVLHESEIATSRTLAVVNWTNEEGPRFGCSLSGSKGYSGYLSPEAVLSLRATDGPTFAKELERLGFGGGFELPHEMISSYVELHIEQGPVLECSGRALGVVSGAQGARWLSVEIAGECRHAGSTPNDMRKDAFMGAARFALDARFLARKLDPELRLTIGKITLSPGSTNTIAGRAALVVDLRHMDEILLDDAQRKLSELLSRVDREEGTKSSISVVSTTPPVTFDADLVNLLRSLAPPGTPVLASGAMHDACMLSRIAPAAMIFVPCRDGVSHDPSEWANPDDIAAGCQLLLDATVVLTNAGVVRRERASKSSMNDRAECATPPAGKPR